MSKTAATDSPPAPAPPVPLKVGIISLGCAKNLVDSEIMLGSLLRDGVELTNDSGQAHVMIVNTCSFIDAAQEESVNAILQSVAERESSRRGQAVVVSGCLPQRFREELPRLMPEVDAFMGIDQVAEVSEIVRRAWQDRQRRRDVGPARRARRAGQKASRAMSAALAADPKAKGKVEAAPAPRLEVHARPTYIPDFATPRFRLTPRSFAYVKIAEGCNHPCSFCIIPRMRGKHRSRAMDDVVREAEALVGEGVRELNLISQDSTYYGLDLRPGHRPNIASPARFTEATRALPADTPTLCALLRRLNALPGEFWVRLLYTHPAHWTEELIETLAASPKVARYVDIPLQHIHDNMLQRMRRETTGQYIRELLARIRAGVPGIALRTTFIVGFPGETEACFNALLDFIRETRFERLGVFTYSREDGTLAGRMSQQVTAAVARRRRDRAMAEQHAVASSLSAGMVGRTLKVLVERAARAGELTQARIQSWEHGLIRGADAGVGRLRGRYWIARSEADAPDIDGRVYVRGARAEGEFAMVKVVGHTDYDLIADPAD